MSDPFPRDHFPTLSPTLAYLDNAAGAMLPRRAIEGVTKYLTEYGGANVKQAFSLSKEVTALKARARERSAVFLNAAPDEVALGSSATALAWQVSRALSRLWGPGDEVVVSELEHEANVSPWAALERNGVAVKVWRARWPEGELKLEDLRALLTPKTRLLALTAAANSVGSLTPVKEAAELARSAGAWTFVDAVHYAAHRLPDVRAWNADFAVMSPYKVFGPRLGLLFVRGALLSQLPADKLSFVPQDDVSKFEAGTAQHELWAGWLGSLEYLAELGGGQFSRETLERAYRRVESLEAPLTGQLVGGLRAIPGVTLYGRPGTEHRVGTACFNVEGLTPQAVAEQLAARGVAVAAGHYYATAPMGALGLLPSGAVRASLAHYTTSGEIGRLLEGVRALA